MTKRKPAPEPARVNPVNADEIKALGGDLGRPATTLIALADVNDPLYITPRRRAEAEWFAALWKKYKVGRGVHLRRLHYLFISQRTPIRMPDGMPYDNTTRCWNDACDRIEGCPLPQSGCR